MKISVVTVCFNVARTIEATLASVAEQTHPHIEHLIVDGGSSDGTLDIVRGWRGHAPTIVSEPDDGIYDAMNKGLRLFTGDAIGFLNADDRFASDSVVSRIAEAIASADGLRFAYGDLVLQRADGSPVRHWRSGPFDVERLSRGWLPPHPTFYVARTLAQRIGAFDTRYRIAADIDWMLRALLLPGIEACHVPEVLVAMSTGGASTKGWRAVLAANREVYRIGRALGVRMPARFVAGKLWMKVRQTAAIRKRTREGG